MPATLEQIKEWAEQARHHGAKKLVIRHSNYDQPNGTRYYSISARTEDELKEAVETGEGRLERVYDLMLDIEEQYNS